MYARKSRQKLFTEAKLVENDFLEPGGQSIFRFVPFFSGHTMVRVTRNNSYSFPCFTADLNKSNEP